MLAPGFERLLLGHAVAVARSDLSAAVRRMLVSADGTRTTLHEYAARHPSSRALQGRGAAYAVPLPTPQTARVVVRHNRHGGLFAPLTGDRFISPTRAPYELHVSLALTRLGIPTPQVVAFALYPPGGILQRSDVVSLEVPGGHDLAHVLVHGHEETRAAALNAAAALVASLSDAGVRHHDLNAKNVLVASDVAYVLDVDRVALGVDPGVALDANLARLSRSLRKWRERFRARVSEDEIAQLDALTRDRLRATYPPRASAEAHAPTH
jgi:tRNA A-37 threonylcarbamoyl transferase component Bud32